jgi:hypothetical protein
MATETTRQVTKTATCPQHGSVQAVKEMPVFRLPGLFYLVRMIASPFQSYRCPQCGAATK